MLVCCTFGLLQLCSLFLAIPSITIDVYYHRIPVSVSGPTKSLREIQEEQARQQMERNKQQAKAQAVSTSC